MSEGAPGEAHTEHISRRVLEPPSLCWPGCWGATKPPQPLLVVCDLVTLHECYKPRYTASVLWGWSCSMQTLLSGVAGMEAGNAAGTRAPLGSTQERSSSQPVLHPPRPPSNVSQRSETRAASSCPSAWKRARHLRAAPLQHASPRPCNAKQSKAKQSARRPPAQLQSESAPGCAALILCKYAGFQFAFKVLARKELSEESAAAQGKQNVSPCLGVHRSPARS